MLSISICFFFIILYLQGTRKAIHIYAPARFPSSHIFKEIPATFNESIPKDIVSSSSPYEVKSKVELSLPNINEKLVFFHVRENHHQPNIESSSSIYKERLSIKQSQDLGVMPNDLRSVSSVLLFNSEYSPYSIDEEDAEQTENWKRAKLFKTKKIQKAAHISPNNHKQILEPAPYSLAHRNEKQTPSGGLKYTPKLSEAPELDLPFDLPDLPGIANDLRYECTEAKQRIAPSLEMVVESLPDLDDLIKDSTKSKSIPNKNNNQDNLTLNNMSTMQSPPPPPPPSIKFAPPPPPPPPPPTVSEPSKISTEKPSAMADTRSELMAAIRNAGGLGKAQLKRAAAPLTNNVDEKNVSKINSHDIKAKTGGGDLMADLHNKLLMRRKGISGAKDNVENAVKTTSGLSTPSGNPVISRLSTLIPPPPPKGRAKNTSDEEDEDSNDTDWVD